MENKKRMIDVKLLKPSDDYREDLVLITRILTWISTTIALEQEKHELMMKGFIVLYDEGKISTLLITDDGEHQQKLLKMLQEPPGEYKEKYVACIMSEEPKVVEEKSDDEKSEKEADIPIEIDET